MATALQKIDEAEFARPEPLPLVGEMVRGAEYPLDSLGEMIAAAVSAISRKVMVPTALAANSVLSACSLAVQPYVNVGLPTDQDRPVSLFFVSVAESGDRKSTTDDIATSEIGTFQRDLQEQHARMEHELMARKLAWDTSKSEALTQTKKRGREAIEQALKDLGPRPQDPMTPVITVRVGTTQGLIKQFEHARPSLGLMSDEGGSWLGGYGLSEDSRLFTVATLSDLWDGKPVQRLTAGEGSTSLYGRRLTFHMMIQPILAGRLLGDAEFKGQGFLSRLLVAQPESLAGTRFVDPHAPVDPSIAADIDAFGRRLALIIRSQLPMDEETRAIDLDDNSLAENSRGSYPIDFIPNTSEKNLGPVPKNIIFLTADAYGVLPPIARLTPEQAMYHFLSGYTARVAGTEIGVTEPTATFSTCFGAPFMPRHPSVYGNLLKERINKGGVTCWLVNTGWSGGKATMPGIKRMAIKVTRALLNAALDGSLNEAEFRTDPNFGFQVPVAVAGVESTILDPRASWADGAAYDETAATLVKAFVDNFAQFEEHVDDGVRGAALTSA